MAKFTGSVLADQLSGKAGTVVFVRGPQGQVYIRPRTTPRDPKTNAQIEHRQRLAYASRAYAQLNLAQVQAWRKFAAEVSRHRGQNAPQGTSLAQNLFTGLAAKWLQVRGLTMGSVPTEPPPTLWVGDAVQLRVFPGPSGTLRVVADQANAAGMTTEILLQPLLRATRSPVLSRYRTTKFFTFGPSLTCDVPTSARVVAVAMRFVALETGQSTPLMELGIIELPDSP